MSDVRIPSDFKPGASSDLKSQASRWALGMMGIDKVHFKGIKGAGVKIAIGDTGWFNHDELPTPKSINQFGYNDFADKNGHSTHVFGICASVAPDSEYFIGKSIKR